LETLSRDHSSKSTGIRCHIGKQMGPRQMIILDCDLYYARDSGAKPVA